MGEHLSQHLHRKTVNAVIEGVRMLLSPHALESLNDIKRIQPRMMYATFNGKTCIMNFSCYSPTYASDEVDITIFYDWLLTLLNTFPNNQLIIGGNMNAQIGKDDNRFDLHDQKWQISNSFFFLLQNSLSCLRTKFQKGRENLKNLRQYWKKN